MPLIPKYRKWLSYYQNNPIEGAKQGIFYIIEFKHKTLSHHFLKVGITSKSIKERYCAKQYKDYTYTVLVEHTTTNLKSAEIENNLLITNQHNRYSFNNHINFDGFSETLTLEIKDDIMYLEECHQDTKKRLKKRNENKKL